LAALKQRFHRRRRNASQVFAPFFFSAVTKVVNTSFLDPSAPLMQRIGERPELYGEMLQRVAHFLEGHPDAP
jgi:hypothetical protein